MKLLEIYKAAKGTNPKPFARVTDERGTRILKLVVQEILRRVNDPAEEGLAIQGFGRFEARQIETEKGGIKTKQRRIRFYPAKANAGRSKGKGRGNVVAAPSDADAES